MVVNANLRAHAHTHTHLNIRQHEHLGSVDPRHGQVEEGSYEPHALNILSVVRGVRRGEIWAVG